MYPIVAHNFTTDNLRPIQMKLDRESNELSQRQYCMVPENMEDLKWHHCMSNNVQIKYYTSSTICARLQWDTNNLNVAQGPDSSYKTIPNGAPYAHQHCVHTCGAELQQGTSSFEWETLACGYYNQREFTTDILWKKQQTGMMGRSSQN